MTLKEQKEYDKKSFDDCLEKAFIAGRQSKQWQIEELCQALKECITYISDTHYYYSDIVEFEELIKKHEEI